jgi:hypothetical protein
VEGDAQLDIDKTWPIILQDPGGGKDGGHAGRVEKHVLGPGLGLIGVNGPALEQLRDALPESIVSGTLRGPGRLGGRVDTLEGHLDGRVDLLEQLLGASDRDAYAGRAPARNQSLCVLRLKDDGVESMAGHVNHLEGQLVGGDGVLLAFLVGDVMGRVFPHDRIEIHHAALVLDADGLGDGSCELPTPSCVSLVVLDYRCQHLNLSTRENVQFGRTAWA